MIQNKINADWSRIEKLPAIEINKPEVSMQKFFGLPED